MSKETHPQKRHPPICATGIQCQKRSPTQEQQTYWYCPQRTVHKDTAAKRDPLHKDKRPTGTAITLNTKPYTLNPTGTLKLPATMRIFTPCVSLLAAAEAAPAAAEEEALEMAGAEVALAGGAVAGRAMVAERALSVQQKAGPHAKRALGSNDGNSSTPIS